MSAVLKKAMSQIDNIIIQVRARLQLLGIKLWLEPYYYDGVGCMEEEIEKLANNFSQDLGMTKSNCKLALTELQEGALRKLAARKEFEDTGLATFSVRRINNKQGTQSIIEVKCALKALGSELQTIVAKSLEIHDPSRIKCISAGKIIDPDRSLEIQNVKNNQQLMVIISEVDRGVEQNQKDAMYDRIRKIKMDVESIVDSSRQLFEMEDQDGNPVFLPPAENRALLMALGYYEKARAAMKRDHYDEALNVTQLPDAQRRLELCEKSFRRSYGENFQRLISLKGSACPEKALIMRLHLLQGVVLFHQNRRNEAYEKFAIAETELGSLKIDDSLVAALVEMGYEPFEARLALRSCSGNVEQAINFIYERKDKLKESRKNSKKERQIHKNLSTKIDNDKDWVNPRSVCTLMEMGFERDVVVEALKRCNNDVPKALDLLQSSAEELRHNLPPAPTADDDILSQLKQLGFNEEMARVALETTENSLDNAMEFLMKMYGNETELVAAMDRMTAAAASAVANVDYGGPSTSSGASSLITKALDNSLGSKGNGIFKGL
ncbi:NEDD8 ultimate buster 1 [Lucilia cuprina]|nr:NEDD8 ultimate buster 1 [Lucilia cuprina]